MAEQWRDAIAVLDAPARDDFGPLLRSLRERAGISGNQLAHRAAIDPSHLNRVEREERGVPRSEMVAALIRALGLSRIDGNRLRLAAGLAPVGLDLGESLLAIAEPTDLAPYMAASRQPGLDPSLSPNARALWRWMERYRCVRGTSDPALTVGLQELLCAGMIRKVSAFEIVEES
jgi:transcriptional regulator with XRE-family HTH domain